MTLDKMITSLYTDKYLGTELYMDRDLIDKFENILVCKEMDVYSFGVLTSVLIFDSVSPLSKFNVMKDCEQYSSLMELVSNCLSFDRKSRWSFERIISENKIILKESSFDSYKKASDLGLSFDQFKVGMCFLKGDGVELNHELAREYFKKSSDQDCVEALHKLKVFEAISVLKWGGLSLKYDSEDLRNDKDFILEAVKQNGWALEYASKDLRNNKVVMLEAFKQNGWALKYASEDLRNDKDFILEAFKQNGWALKYASVYLRNDKDFILEAVKQNGWALNYASEDLRNDKDFILEAVKQNGRILQYASNNLRNNKEVMLEAVKQGESALNYASENLKNDKEFNLEVMKQNIFSLEKVSDLRNEKEAVLATVKWDGLSLKYASEDLRNNKEVVLEAARQNGHSWNLLQKNLETTNSSFRSSSETEWMGIEICFRRSEK
jgi:hypothetical protein